MAAPTFGPWLIATLADLGWTQAELVRRLRGAGEDVTAGAVSQWCSGTTIPGPRRLAVIVQVMCVDDAQAREALRAVGEAARTLDVETP